MWAALISQLTSGHHRIGSGERGAGPLTTGPAQRNLPNLAGFGEQSRRTTDRLRVRRADRRDYADLRNRLGYSRMRRMPVPIKPGFSDHHTHVVRVDY